MLEENKPPQIRERYRRPYRANAHIIVPQAIHEAVKLYAASRNITLSRAAEELLQAGLIYVRK